VHGTLDLEPGFLLHRGSAGESSARLALLLKQHGRLAISARGVHRAGSKQKLHLEPFREQLWSARGRGTMTLTHVEPLRQSAALGGNALVAGLYLNELVIRLLPVGEPAPALYDRYRSALERLSEPTERRLALRRVEAALLDAIGQAPDWTQDCEQRALDPAQRYRLVWQEGWRACLATAPDAVDGATILQFCSGEAVDADALTALSRAFRRYLDHTLDGRPLRSRELWQREP
jgi:DNA repair protein RecO (recombination protein O)